MINYSENDYPYAYDGYYVPEQRDSSDWSASTSAGTPMTREPSGESAISTYSSNFVQTPSSDYDAYGSLWSSSPADHEDFLRSSLGSDSSYENASSVPNHGPPYMGSDIPGNIDNYNTGRQDSWWEDYQFVTELEHGQEPHWRLYPGLEPTDQRPATRPAENTSTTASQFQRNEGMYICLEAGCPKSFRRKADLQRHLAQMHRPKDKRPKYPCDWKKCQRTNKPFYRRDHQREHYREFHHEDLLRRGSSGRDDQDWWGSRFIHPDWWRCSRCLERVKVGDYGYTCPTCRISCEQERQYYRTAR